MSKTLRIAFVVEGPTDLIILEEVIAKFLEGRDFVPRYFQPEMSAVFQPVAGEHGLGWPGVCRWCRQVAKQAGGRARDNVFFDLNDLLVLQVDADIAGSSYAAGHIDDPFPGISTLPCEEPCPPPSATTDRLRALVLRWLGERTVPPSTVFCIPSKALETWLLVGLFPKSTVVSCQNDIECRQNPAKTLRGQAKERRLVSGNHKNEDKYRQLAPEFVGDWTRVAERCSEARLFEQTFRSALATFDSA